MTTVEISLPEELKEFVERQVLTGSYRDASDYIQFLLQDARLAQQRTEIDRELRKGVEALERGDASEMSAQDWQRLRTEYRNRIKQRNVSWTAGSSDRDCRTGSR